MGLRRTLVTALVLTAVIPATARAEGMIIPYFGVNFGGDSGKDFGDAFDSDRFNYGVSFTFMGGGFLGAESDISYSPDFYGKSDLGGSSNFTFMGNMILGIPFGGQTGFGVRPYAIGGLGLIRSDIESFGEAFEVTENQFAWNFGGGVMVFFGTHFGLRGDVRYFRTFEDLEILGVNIGNEEAVGAVDYTRGSLGFIFRF